MKTIFITITRGSLIRNFFHTGVIKRLLDAGIRIVVLSPFSDTEKYFKDYLHPHLLFEPFIESKQTFAKRVMRELLTGAVFNRTIHARYLHRITAAEGPPSKIWYVPRMLFFAPLRFIPGFKKLIRLIDFLVFPQKQHDYLFKKYKPDMVFSTNPMDSYGESSVLKGAKRFGAKTVSMPKSWDNMSKILFNVKSDVLIVWSQFMKDQAISLQNYSDHDVIVAGAPQFDYYADKKNLMTREEFCNANGLDPNKKILLYGSVGSHACYESHYPELIKKYIDNGDLRDINVFIRSHPGYIGDAEQFKPVTKHSSFILDTHDKQDSALKDNWDISMNHLHHLFNSLYHADVCVTVGSTLTIDATMCGTPVINIRFDADPNIDKKMSVKRLHKADYVRAITGIGATWVADSEQDFLQALKETLILGRKKEEGMERLVEYLAYKKDGRAAERVAKVLLGAIQ